MDIQTSDVISSEKNESTLSEISENIPSKITIWEKTKQHEQRNTRRKYHILAVSKSLFNYHIGCLSCLNYGKFENLLFILASCRHIYANTIKPSFFTLIVCWILFPWFKVFFVQLGNFQFPTFRMFFEKLHVPGHQQETRTVGDFEFFIHCKLSVALPKSKPSVQILAKQGLKTAVAKHNHGQTHKSISMGKVKRMCQYILEVPALINPAFMLI